MAILLVSGFVLLCIGLFCLFTVSGQADERADAYLKKLRGRK